MLRHHTLERDELIRRYLNHRALSDAFCFNLLIIFIALIIYDLHSLFCLNEKEAKMSEIFLNN